ncbi:MAG: PDZ domain-containing protein, partial [Actinobacteria bacterium]|nr:PDZ domain-containing protein [Actinomycetota bacterium]NIS31846.1 PDZ domain-containing protein [Actinomycetota bacterium]NIU70223.1 PDZ domain-containing protein [Actinomycetota bacterium]NIW32109.1 PDZ domain-containing protein [Actinomycetota bacterium]NIX24341.1 PDZ domain-containing protein [Actinomycetota bacterium]
GSKAVEAGMRAGDRVAAVDGRPVTTFTDLKLALWRKQVGERVEVTVSRADDESVTMEITLVGGL